MVTSSLSWVGLRWIQKLSKRVEDANVHRLEYAESAARPGSAAKNIEAQRKASKRSK
jgi:hypothetical protein